jgi:hypothetical protein
MCTLMTGCENKFGSDVVLDAENIVLLASRELPDVSHIVLLVP